jgi:hypothetical protein
VPEEGSVPRVTRGKAARVRPEQWPGGIVPPGLSVRRSRIGWGVPLLGMPVALAVSAVLAVTKATPPGIGVIALFWGFVQAVWVGGPTLTRRSQLPHADREQMLLTGRSWTGLRTLNLAELSRVRRVKFTFSNQFGTGTRRVDYLTLTDGAGVSLTMPRSAATGAVQTAVAYQREHGLPEARISRYAAMGMGLVANDLRFRMVRTLAVFVAVVCYVFAVGFLIVKGIPVLAGYHGG